MDELTFIAFNTVGSVRVLCSSNSEVCARESAKMIVSGGVAKPTEPALKAKVKGIVVLPFKEAKKQYGDVMKGYYRW